MPNSRVGRCSARRLLLLLVIVPLCFSACSGGGGSDQTKSPIRPKGPDSGQWNSMQWDSGTWQ